MDQIFDPLKRGPAQPDSYNTDSGLGLGLYIVREVAGRMGARSMCVPTRQKPCSRCAYLAATRPAFLISTSLRFRKISRRRSVWPFGGEEPTRIQPSLNFRGKEKYRPFYDLICNIATEEYSHIEAVAAAINLLLTGATMRADATSRTAKPQNPPPKR